MISIWPLLALIGLIGLLPHCHYTVNADPTTTPTDIPQPYDDPPMLGAKCN